MGCCVPTKPKKTSIKPILDKSRISSELSQKASLPTSRGTVQVLYKSEFKEKFCLKLKIFEEFQEVFPASVSESCENNPSLTSYKKNIRYIKKSWNLFKTSYSYFLEMTHGCCIDNYSIIDGVLILLVSVLASGASLDSDVSFISQAPFIIINTKTNEDTSCIVKSWESFSRTVQAFCLKKLGKLAKVIQKFESLLESYEDFEPDQGEEKEFKKSEKNIRKLIDCATGLKKDVDDAVKYLMEFVRFFDQRKNEVLGLAQEAKKNLCFTGEYIVHIVLNK